ncbi:MAG: hypothetical protein ACOYMW_10695 [Candidatus Competibacteraceae bacterium]
METLALTEPLPTLVGERAVAFANLWRDQATRIFVPARLDAALYFTLS